MPPKTGQSIERPSACTKRNTGCSRVEAIDTASLQDHQLDREADIRASETAGRHFAA